MLTSSGGRSPFLLEVAAGVCGLSGVRKKKFSRVDVLQYLNVLRHRVALRPRRKVSQCVYEDFLPSMAVGVTAEFDFGGLQRRLLALDIPSSKDVLWSGVALILYVAFHVKDPIFTFFLSAHVAGVRAPSTSAQRLKGAGRPSPGDSAADQRTSVNAAPRLLPGGAGGKAAEAAAASPHAAHIGGPADRDPLTGEPYTVRRRLYTGLLPDPL